MNLGGPEDPMQNPRLSFSGVLDGQVDGVARVPVAVRIVKRRGCDERLAVDRHNAVADSQTRLLGRTAAHDIDNRNCARAGIIQTRICRLVEAKLDGRARVTHVVHPDRAVENRGSGEERG
jgi:hypothetical protein